MSTSSPIPAPTPEGIADDVISRRLEEVGAAPGSLRRTAARGAIVNGAFLIAVTGLGLLKGFVVAGFISAHDYGVWGLLFISLGTLYWLRDVGVGDKFVQQDEADQELAFQKAFTLELVVAGVFTVVLAAALPLLAIIYGNHEIVLPGLAIVSLVPAIALQTPVWVFYRRMQYARQRTLQAVDPCVGFVTTIACAIAGLGYWSFVVGAVAGSWSGALVALRACPYPLRLRFERGTARSYAGFSWPLLLANGSSMLVVQGSILIAQRAIGVVGVGIITLASSISAYTDRVDAIVTQTLYPAICAVKQRTDLLLESFVKSNRLALMWGMPFGVGLALFAADLVHFGIGDRWTGAIGMIRAFGLIAAVNHIGFNWSAFFRARGETRPMAVVGVLILVSLLACGIPLTRSLGLDGFALTVAIMGSVHLAGRTFYLRRLFGGFHMLRHALRAVAPTVPAAAAVLGARLIEPGPRTFALAAAELALYLGVTAAATWAFERPLLREVAGYLRRQAPAAPA